MIKYDVYLTYCMYDRNNASGPSQVMHIVPLINFKALVLEQLFKETAKPDMRSLHLFVFVSAWLFLFAPVFFVIVCPVRIPSGHTDLFR
jgi:hypothetical protein